MRDGSVVAAAEEERFTRRKHDAGFPYQAARWCLEAEGIVAEELDYVVFYEKPLVKFERILSSYGATFPRSSGVFIRALRTWLSDKLWVRGAIRDGLGYSGPVLFGEHHLSHAASAFYPSPFDDAAVVTADGVGEWATTTLGVGRGRKLELTHEIRYPHSIGLLYSAFTAYLGFEVNDGEYKVMGMAAYGRPRYADAVRRLIRLAEDGSFRLDMRYFAYHRSLRALDRAFVELFGPPRAAGSELDQRHADIAASAQAVTEEAMLGFARRARELTGSRNLCLAGGVALNVLANARVLREAGFDGLWVQPAAGDSGGCVGAAAYVAHAVLGEERRPMETVCLGPGYSDEEIRSRLDRLGVPYTRLAEDELPATVARLLASRSILGWFQGRMEFGPRALGSRSILADPRDSRMKDELNERIKHREQFRPLAPSVLREAAHELFDFGGRDPDPESPFMLLVARVRDEARTRIPAVTHEDGTARVQTVRRDDHPRFHSVIEAFGRLTGVPVVINTSFNVGGEPIVRTPEEAFNTFAHTDLDYLVIGDALVAASAKRQLGPYPGRVTLGAGTQVVV